MRFIQGFGLVLLVVAMMMNCGKNNDEADIQALLDRTWFMGGELQTQDDSTGTPSLLGGPALATDTFPFYVKWVRWIERPVDRHYDIDVVGDSAFVTMTAYLQGTPPGYGFFVANDSPVGPVLPARAITDSVVRKAKCFRDDAGWHLASITVADIYTVGAQHPVTISEIRARVASRNYEFVVNSADKYFEKDELPIFYPSDTVEVTVTCSADGDSTWAFLHHGAGHRPGVGLRRHWRQPFYRENTTTFKRTWIIADDSVITTPAVRHSAVDVLGWTTLFGDSTATYYSRAWGIPYIIKSANDTLPGDEEP
uniref:Uncharacterized protein n=1 Tax=candidate division WOR-3 bacterium TaxID=2052148 RepID=A0A7V0Z5W6_UNCW3